jgi:hypothetical protein
MDERVTTAVRRVIEHGGDDVVHQPSRFRAALADVLGPAGRELHAEVAWVQTCVDLGIPRELTATYGAGGASRAKLARRLTTAGRVPASEAATLVSLFGSLVEPAGADATPTGAARSPRPASGARWWVVIGALAAVALVVGALVDVTGRDGGAAAAVPPPDTTVPADGNASAQLRAELDAERAARVRLESELAASRQELAAAQGQAADDESELAQARARADELDRELATTRTDRDVYRRNFPLESAALRDAELPGQYRITATVQEAGCEGLSDCDAVQTVHDTGVIAPVDGGFTLTFASGSVEPITLTPVGDGSWQGSGTTALGYGFRCGGESEVASADVLLVPTRFVPRPDVAGLRVAAFAGTLAKHAPETRCTAAAIRYDMAAERIA